MRFSNKMEATCRLLIMLAVVMVSMAIVEAGDDSYTRVRTRRDLIGLGNMISSVTGKGLFGVMTTYNGYGCYCGIGGHGEPVDDVDRCCQTHDQCFTTAQKGVCSTSKKTIYSQSYKYKSKDTSNNKNGVHAEIECTPVSHYKKDSAAQALCSKTICECDRQVASCLATHKHNDKNRGYDRKKCGY
ncbi:phospholipase A2-like [Patiria miniata]|uniref:Phosphatidylcholine 2-acylhydrolase n=1 Tax=Patiria miniata TaxID=46514 RepID=A0A914BGF3_PATMI|nr:phospholipase A2-like [Patiria miniata]